MVAVQAFDQGKAEFDAVAGDAQSIIFDPKVIGPILHREWMRLSWSDVSSRANSEPGAGSRLTRGRSPVTVVAPLDSLPALS